MYTHHNNFIEKHRVSCGHSTHTLKEVELVFFLDITAFLSLGDNLSASWPWKQSYTQGLENIKQLS